MSGKNWELEITFIQPVDKIECVAELAFFSCYLARDSSNVANLLNQESVADIGQQGIDCFRNLDMTCMGRLKEGFPLLDFKKQ